MVDVLDKIDASLEEVEEQLLGDFYRALDAGSADGFVKLDPGVRNALAEVTDSLHDELQNSGRSSLSLVTERHEVLYSRIAVLRVLFNSHVRIQQLVAARDGIEKRRDDLEARVRQERRRLGVDPAERPKAGATSRFDHQPTAQEKQRNRLEVTANEEERLGQEQLYLDNGIFSASRELAMLVSLMRGGTLDRPPEESDDKDSPTPAGKAVFQAKDLSYHAPPPERVERERPAPAPKPEISQRDIAQSPEEIRRKLEARRGQSEAGPASFAARDLASHTPSEPPRPRARPQAPEQAEPPKPAGKATFAARELSSHTPSEPPRKREKKPEEKPAEEKKKGPAVFESRELSNTPFPKKD